MSDETTRLTPRLTPIPSPDSLKTDADPDPREHITADELTLESIPEHQTLACDFEFPDSEPTFVHVELRGSHAVQLSEMSYAR
jgi:hypothetical protein